MLSIFDKQSYFYFYPTYCTSMYIIYIYIYISFSYVEISVDIISFFRILLN